MQDKIEEDGELEEGVDFLPMSDEEWEDQKLTGAKLRSLREQAGMTPEEMAAKMGEPYTAETVTQYEEGSVPMEISPFFAMIGVLKANIEELDPAWLKAKLSIDNGYAYLSRDNRMAVDKFIGHLLADQRAGG